MDEQKSAEVADVQPEFSGSAFNAVSENMIEMWMERDPAKWAAYQIAAKGSECKTVGEAMDMIEGIVRQAMDMKPND